jgi:hypothetical protein
MPDRQSPALVSRRTIVIGAAIALAFLLGFLIQFRAASQARSSRDAAEAEAARLRQQLTQAEVRDLAALMLFEVTQRNFGTASQHSTALFDRLQSLAGAGGRPFSPVSWGGGGRGAPPPAWLKRLRRATASPLASPPQTLPCRPKCSASFISFFRLRAPSDG